ncbi:MAG: ribonuclease HII [Nitrospira sp. OLB3]|nr:MAG: ribonuclease HII [Nitrospira sp. OLB3]
MLGTPSLTTWGPTEDFEGEARCCGYRCVAGLDEAGRGPLAGPVVAAAVVLPRRCRLVGLNDSKQISEADRLRLFDEIVHRAVGIGVGAASEWEIDRLNILEATKLAMRRALGSLPPPPDFLLLDAVTLPGIPVPQRSLIKGDGLSCSIAAASIIAKVTRDRLMVEYHRWYPQYNFAEHKGYGTPDHLRRLRRHGPCPIHRASFSPISRLESRSSQLFFATDDPQAFEAADA